MLVLQVIDFNECPPKTNGLATTKLRSTPPAVSGSNTICREINYKINI